MFPFRRRHDLAKLWKCFDREFVLWTPHGHRMESQTDYLWDGRLGGRTLIFRSDVRKRDCQGEFLQCGVREYCLQRDVNSQLFGDCAHKLDHQERMPAEIKEIAFTRHCIHMQQL